MQLHVAAQPVASCSPRCEGLRPGSGSSHSGDTFRLRQRQQRPRWAPVRALTDVQDTATETSTRRPRDVWADAGLRLQNLLSGVGDGEMEMVNEALENEPGPTKLAFAAAAGSIILLGASAICWLCGTDPLGGASLSPHSLKAAEVGLLAATPLVAAKAWSWTEGAHERFPALEQLQRDRMEQLEPLLMRMTLPQAGVAMLFDTLPTLVLGLPATLGALSTAFAAVLRELTRHSGAPLPESLPFALALMVAASLAAASGSALSADPSRSEEDEVVSTALVNADRYYRVMAPEAPEEAARAFKNVAAAWLDQRRSGGELSGFLMAGQIVFLGLLWKLTGDLSAPAAAAVSGAAVDTWHMHSRLNRRADRAQ